MNKRQVRPAKEHPNADLGWIHPDRLDASFQGAFGLVAFIMNRHLVDHMVRSTRKFNIDYQTMVLWAVLAHQNCAHLFPPGSLPSQILNEHGRLRDSEDATLRPVRLRHLSEIAGVPRETTRRKLKVLRDAGWITEVKQGWVVDPEKIDSEVRAFTLENTRRFLAAAVEVTRALRNAERQLPE